MVVLPTLCIHPMKAFKIFVGGTLALYCVLIMRGQVFLRVRDTTPSPPPDHEQKIGALEHRVDILEHTTQEQAKTIKAQRRSIEAMLATSSAARLEVLEEAVSPMGQVAETKPPTEPQTEPQTEPKDAVDGRCGSEYPQPVCDCISDRLYCSTAGWCGNSEAHKAGNNRKFDCPHAHNISLNISQERAPERAELCDTVLLPRALANLTYSGADAAVEAELDRKTMRFLCVRDGRIKASSAQQYRKPVNAAAKPGPRWLPEYERRTASLTAEQNESRLSIATAATARLMGAIALLETIGLRPVVSRGLLIGAVRHHGWIDFGGTDYGSGYDTDADITMPVEDIVKLLKVNKESPDALKPFTVAQAESDSSLRRYVEIQCDEPELTKAFYTSLGINLSMPNGATLMYEGKPAADFTAMQSWTDTGAQQGGGSASYLFPFCWRNIQGIKPGRSNALRVPLQWLYPAKRLAFYGEFEVPAPANYSWFAQQEWGG